MHPIDDPFGGPPIGGGSGGNTNLISQFQGFSFKFSGMCFADFLC